MKKFCFKVILSMFIISSNMYAGTSNISKYSHKIDKNCIVKGNISYNSDKKYYFTSGHRDYANVNINREGERCFSTEAEARRAGWTKAPN